MRNAPRERPRKGPFFYPGPLSVRRGPQLKIMRISQIVVASRNAHKTAEIAAMLAGLTAVRNLRDFPDAPEPVEDAPTFSGNALKKAVALANWLASRPPAVDFWVLADDSGLEVDALNGAPGVFSARFAALDTGATGNSSDAANNAKLIRLLAGVDRPWTARFRCAIALTPVPTRVDPASSPTCLLDEAEAGAVIFEGACPGQIIPEARGAHGFGYDPFFVPDGFNRTFAELTDAEKNKVSHRARAMEKLRAALLRGEGRGPSAG